MANFEYFKKDITITGKYADYVDALWTQNQIQQSYFKRLVDLCTIAPVIGLRAKHKVKASSEGENKRTVQLQQIMTRREDLITILQMIILMDESDGLTIEQRVDRAFRGPENETDYQKDMELFTQYLLGGIEILYDELFKRSLSMDDEYSDLKVGNIIALLNKPFDL
ncbi:hypothetical protein SAMN02910451_00667 [Butyrivibrio hungatei]|uniref:Uncharacterized protein n=1 Tax=Butyrivibrio hungatei TaxID=185008 RepID=A0A1G5BD98_9FIRM|nr:hypothetical protein [Butyrivibrio hungatei]SCX88125.1 hypothetical protein SAMN02910451_00667 [Butyrivibrio hungatei]